MARAARLKTARDQGDHWPGFVDALATLLLVVTFLLTVFVVGQSVLGQALQGRDERITALEARLASLAEQLGLAQAENSDLLARNASLESRLATLVSDLQSAKGENEALLARLTESETALDEEKAKVLAAGTKVDELAALIEQLNAQLASLNEALDASEAKNKDLEAQVFNLGKRLNAALATKVQELARIRSEFFAKLLEALGDRDDVRVVGDRFIFETDILFESGSAELNEFGLESLTPIAEAINETRRDIPADVEWVLRVDGHTDRVPISNERYPSNWHLSADRAISVVNYFESKGVPAQRLVAAGFGEHQPISSESLAKNRRIELKLTSR